MSNLDKARALQARTKTFAVQIIRFYSALPQSDVVRIIGRQLLRSGTSVAANYRAVCRSKSQSDFISKMGTVVEETDETLLWLELLIEAEIVKNDKTQNLVAETTELLKIFSKSLLTAKNSNS
ncbi:MAG: four helix bundle protein [Kiritimatiellia bacterium]